MNWNLDLEDYWDVLCFEVECLVQFLVKQKFSVNGMIGLVQI